MSEQYDKYIPITEREVPNIINEQLEKFDLGTIHSQDLMSFDPVLVLNKLHCFEGRRVIGADFGGDKGITKLFIVQNGKLVDGNEYEDIVKSDLGDGYLDSLEKTAKFASENNIPIGISWGGPISGTNPLKHPKVKNFIDSLQQKYDGDFNNLLPTLKSFMNDGPAGLLSAAIEANRSHNASRVILPINGGGLGAAVLMDGKIFSTEAGHIEGVNDLNMYSQHTPCGVFDAEYVCIERLGANKAGIEAQWEQNTGEGISAREIEDRYRSGDKLAADLYDHSALVVAHMILGVAKAYDIDLTNNNTVVAGHGGAFKFPYYGKRVQQILNNNLKAEVNFIMTKDYVEGTSNACLDGAAIAAVIAE